jgi:glucokinase
MVGAVDIGGTKIAVGIVDPEGRVRSCLETETQAAGPYESALERTVAMLKTVVAESGITLQGIGIGSTGPVYPFTGEFGDVNFFPHWRGQNPVKDLQKIFGVSVAIENDADAAALGEFGWGSGRNKSRLVYVTVGTGIGAGIILNGEVYRGAQQAHPEIGHHVIDASGPLCLCGFHGCWESLAAGPAMVSWLESNASPGYPHLAGLTAKRICELARKGDKWAQRAVEREAHYLGLGLANLVSMFVPDAIVLGGSVMKSADLLLDGIRKVIAASCRFVPYESTELAMASLGESSNLIGAARVWYNRFGSAGGQRIS